MPPEPNPVKPAAQPRVLPAQILIDYVCPGCGVEQAQHFQADLTAENKYRDEVPALDSSCGHCKIALKRPKMVVSYIINTEV